MPRQPLSIRISRKAYNELIKTAQFYSQPMHQWRLEHRIWPDLNSNRRLMGELFRTAMANRDPSLTRQLLNYSAQCIRQLVPQIQKQQLLNVDPSHPSVTNNINHPLNPSNPNNLLLNAAMNLLVQQDVNTQAAILEIEIAEAVENEQKEDKLINEILTDEVIHHAAEKGIEHNPEINPYEVLGLSKEATQEQIEAAALSHLAQEAPAPNEKPSPQFHKIAAAVTILLAPHKNETFHAVKELSITNRPAGSGG